jgi:hypothetical protein
VLQASEDRKRSEADMAELEKKTTVRRHAAEAQHQDFARGAR